MDVHFVPVATDPPQVSDDGWLDATVECDEEQSVAGGGLSFRVMVTNGGEESLRLASPYEAMTYQVTDTEGWPISMSAPSRATKVYGFARSAAAKASYLILTDAEIDGEGLATDEAVAADYFELPSGATLAVGVLVPSVRAAYRSETLQPPTAGTYHVTVLLPLVWIGRGDRQAVLLRSAEPLTISLRDVK